jgi:hypothetical protein
MTTASHHYQTSGSFRSPVDDQLYDLLQALVSKCEAIEAYAKYEQDSDDQAKSLFQELGERDVQAAERLLEAVRARLEMTAGSRSMSSEPVPA